MLSVQRCGVITIEYRASGYVSLRSFMHDKYWSYCNQSHTIEQAIWGVEKVTNKPYGVVQAELEPCGRRTSQVELCSVVKC